MEQQSPIEIVAERVKKVFSNVKTFLEGCGPAEHTVQFLFDKLEPAWKNDETASDYVRDEVATLVHFLGQCSNDLLDSNSIEDVVRVEVVNRILFSTLQNFKEPLDGLAHLEKLTQERDHFHEEILAYGYTGITLTMMGSLQIATSQLINSGNLALEIASLLEPSLSDEMMRFWFWGHLQQLAACSHKMGMYEECIPWYEAALRMAKFGLNYEAASSNYDVGHSFYLAALHCDVGEKREEMLRRAVTHLKNSIHLFDDSPGETHHSKALKVSKAHELIGQWAYEELKDFALSLQHFGKGVEIAAANSLHHQESDISAKYGTLLLEAMPEKLDDISSAFRQSLEAALKISYSTGRSLGTIHVATMNMNYMLPRCFKARSSEIIVTCPYPLPCFKEVRDPQFSIHDDVLQFPPSLTMARARAQYYLGIDYYYHGKLEGGIEMLQSGLKTLEAEPQIDGTGRNWWQKLSAIIHTHLGQLLYINARYGQSARHFYFSAQMHDDLKIKLSAWLYEANALVNCGDHGRALDVIKVMLSQNLTESDFSTGRAGLLACKGIIEHTKRDFEASILSLQEARKINEEMKVLEIRHLVFMHMTLVEAYLAKHEYWAASHLVKHFQPIMDKYHKGDSVWHIWQAFKAIGHQLVGDLRRADETMEKFDAQHMVVLESTSSRSLKSLRMWVQASLYRREKDVDSCLEQYGRMEQLIKELESEDPGCLVPANETNRITLREKPNILLAEIRINRAAILVDQVHNKQDLERGWNESQQAVLSVRKEAGHDILLARALACQAVAGMNLPLEGNWNFEVNKLIDEALQLVETRDRLLLAKFKYVKATIVEKSDPSTAEAAGREAALIFAELQLQLKDMESAWVSMFGLEMRHLFIFMQRLFLDRQHNMPMKALLWAERGRTRLFVYLIRQLGDIDFLNVKHSTAALDRARADELADDLQQSLTVLNQFGGPQQALGQVSSAKEECPRESSGRGCDGPVRRSTPELHTKCLEGTYNYIGDAEKLSGLDALWFDKDDVLAEKHLLQAMAKCGPRALILEYTFVKEPAEHLLIYLVFIDSGNRHVVEWTEVQLQAIMEEKRGGPNKWKWGKTLATLIHKTRELIVKKKDDEAMEGLSLLHSFLIEPVQKYVNGCQRLILAVHEQLVLVPFAALFNKNSGKFLIQENAISYIPSIRVLHYCFYRQREFEREMHEGLLGPPFIAGNPEPMGWGMANLPDAAEEAKLVAQILGVQPCIGKELTKHAVKAGLSNGSMVLLATHGVVDSYFPHGALILQGPNDSSVQQVDKMDSSSSAIVSSSNLRGHFFERLRNSPNGNHDEWPDVAINADELASLPRGIRAGLVVLSACKSAEGEVTSEGLLGLGRALLQGGAPVAILTLWEVADSSTKVLVAGVFEQLVKQRKNAAEAVQLTMLQMMENKEKTYNIFHWAPLVVVGSPIFKYIQGPSHSFGAE